MKNYTQVYVENSIEAVEMYCKAFNAEVSFKIMNGANDAYEHCELSVNGEPFLAAAEAPCHWDTSIVLNMKWQAMTFNAFELGTEEAVDNAFKVLSDGGVVIEPIHEVPWNKYCATVMDKYGVCWWLAI